MRWLADENVEHPVILALRNDQHDVASVVEISPRLDDPDVLAWANEEGRILLTNDRDFGELAFRHRQARSGIVLLRFRIEEADWKAQQLMGFLDRYPYPLDGRFVVLREGAARVRHMT